MGLGRMTSIQSLTWIFINQTTSCLVYDLGTFDVRKSHEQPRIHNTHHSSDLREATTFPLIIFFAPLHGAMSKWHFVTGFLSGSPEIPTARIPATLGAHNFACKPLIVMKSEAKL
jgi:hypothetical protein